jgi:hypothetical protein
MEVGNSFQEFPLHLSKACRSRVLLVDAVEHVPTVTGASFDEVVFNAVVS